MYKGFIKCSNIFAKRAGFDYEYKHKLNNGMTNYFNCKVTDLQLEGMEKYWNDFRLDKKMATWDLIKKVQTTGSITEGDCVVSLIGLDRCFYTKYSNITHRSVLQEWIENNGIYDIILGRYVKNGFMADETHIRSDLTECETARYWLADGITCDSTINRLNNYITFLKNVQKDLLKLNNNN